MSTSASGTRVGSCGYPVNLRDTHKICFDCLGVGHVMSSCLACKALSTKARQKREVRLHLWQVLPSGSLAPRDKSKTTLQKLLLRATQVHHSTAESPGDSDSAVDSVLGEEDTTPPHPPPASGESGTGAPPGGAPPLNSPEIQRTGAVPLGPVRQPQ